MATETGFPSPAQGYEATAIDLNALLVHNPPATYYMRMQGQQLLYRGIFPEDLLVVDRSRSPSAGCLVVFRRDEDFSCRELVREGEGYMLADGTGERIQLDGETEIFGTGNRSDTKTMILHIDANSFYASCERLFRPDLAGKPIVVLSNNDGIIIALNDEAKAKGFHRGDAYFKVAEECDRKGVAVFSSNYTLYADISARLVTIYNRLCPDVEIYSIDECFLYYPDWKCPDFTGIAWHIRNAVLEGNGHACLDRHSTDAHARQDVQQAREKKRRRPFIRGKSIRKQCFGEYPVGDVWGIGWSKQANLERQGIRTALDLKKYPLDLAKKNLTITGFRTVQELNGIPAIDRNEIEKRQNICSSNSFGEAVFKLDEIEEALSMYTHEAVSRLREQKERGPLRIDLSDDKPLGRVGAAVLQPAFGRPSKTDIVSPGHSRHRDRTAPQTVPARFPLPQGDGQSARPRRRPPSFSRIFLKLTCRASAKKQALMKCFDAVNDRYGRNALALGASVLSPRKWNMQRKFLSPAYTTDLAFIPEVH